MSRPWDADEISWALECAAAGDTPEDIAEMAGRDASDVAGQLAHLRPLSEKQRAVAAMYAAGTPVREIGRTIKPDSSRPGSLAMSHIVFIESKGYPVRRRMDGGAHV